MKRARKQRRALSQIGGTIRTAGDREQGALLAAAWRAASDQPAGFTHGFHAYPARVHPLVARSLLHAFSRPGAVVLDPFAGSGTVLVEALAAGQRALGVDVNPVAVLIAAQKVRRPDRATRRALEETAAAVAGRARSDSRARTIDVRWPPAAAEWFAPIQRAELTALAAGIARIRSAERRAALLAVLSSILIKVSHRRSETDGRRVARRLPPGATVRLFRDRMTELALAWSDLSRAASRETPTPLVLRGDARRLPVRDRSVDLVLTSPPYLGTYDYAGMQVLRALLLGLDLSTAGRLEIGARASAQHDQWNARDAFRDDLTHALAEFRRVLEPGGRALIVIGDSAVGREVVPADRLLADAAALADLAVVAGASQERAPTHAPAAADARRRGRLEHIVLLAAR